MTSIITTKPGNEVCADCNGTEGLTWVAFPHGVLICIYCSGVHRSLGVHITQVTSSNTSESLYQYLDNIFVSCFFCGMSGPKYYVRRAQ